MNVRAMDYSGLTGRSVTASAAQCTTITVSGDAPPTDPPSCVDDSDCPTGTVCDGGICVDATGGGGSGGSGIGGVSLPLLLGVGVVGLAYVSSRR